MGPKIIITVYWLERYILLKSDFDYHFFLIIYYKYMWSIHLLRTIIHHWKIVLLWNKMLLKKAISYHKNIFLAKSVTENGEISCNEFSKSLPDQFNPRSDWKGWSKWNWMYLPVHGSTRTGRSGFLTIADMMHNTVLEFISVNGSYIFYRT